MTRAARTYDKQPCGATVHVAETDTTTKRQRIYQARRAGRPPDVCGRRSAWVVDGKPLCLNHAGQCALRILSEAGI